MVNNTKLAQLQHVSSQKSRSEQLNEELGLYIPADVKEDYEIANYDKLFYLLRKYFITLPNSTKEEVEEIFHTYYNLPENKKNPYLVSTENSIEKQVRQQEELEIVFGEDLLVQKMIAIYSLLDNEQDKAEFLYFVENGDLPNENVNLNKYYDEVRMYDISAEDQAKIRLAQVLDNRNRFDARKHLGKPLSPEDIENFIQKGR